MATFLKIGFLALALFFQGSYAQQISIANPTQGTTLTPGQKLNVVLKVQSTTSSVNFIAFSTGFKTTKYQGPTSLGRPYVGSVFPGTGSDVTLDPSKRTYSFDITVPSASNFTDGLPGTYQFTLANYHLLGATFTPTLKLTGVEVSVQNGNASAGSSNSTQANGKGPLGNNSAKLTSDLQNLKTLYIISTFLISPIISCLIF